MNTGYIFAGYYICMCTITFVFYAADKARAKKGKWRISEKTLLTLSFIGGSAGAFAAMHLLHHKTQDIKFKTGIPLSVILHIVLAAAAVYLKKEII